MILKYELLLDNEPEGKGIKTIPSVSKIVKLTPGVKIETAASKWKPIHAI